MLEMAVGELTSQLLSDCHIGDPEASPWPCNFV